MQQINLYKAEFKPQVIVLNAFEMMLITLAVIVVLLITSLVSQSQLADHKQALQQNQTAYANNQQKLQTLQQTIKRYTQQTENSAQLKLLELKLAAKQTMLEQIQQESINQSSGFSSVLSGLSQQHIDQVWLNEFSILRGGEAITLHGSSTQARFIPEYIDSLSQSEKFKGKQFSIFEMHQPDNVLNSYDFKLTSRPSAKSK